MSRIAEIQQVHQFALAERSAGRSSRGSSSTDAVFARTFAGFGGQRFRAGSCASLSVSGWGNCRSEPGLNGNRGAIPFR